MNCLSLKQCNLNHSLPGTSMVLTWPSSVSTLNPKCCDCAIPACFSVIVLWSCLNRVSFISNSIHHDIIPSPMIFKNNLLWLLASLFPHNADRWFKFLLFSFDTFPHCTVVQRGKVVMHQSDFFILIPLPIHGLCVVGQYWSDLVNYSQTSF